MKNPFFRNTLLLLTLITTACSSPLKTQHDFDPETDFSAYRNFSWVAENPMMAASTSTNPLVGQRVERALMQTLTKKGYRFVNDLDSAEFAVGFTVGARDRVDISRTLEPIGMAAPYQWGRVYQREIYQEGIDVREYTEGQLAVDIFDIRAKQPVWHGRAVKDISSSDMNNIDKVVNAAVAAILKDFPPQ